MTKLKLLQSQIRKQKLEHKKIQGIENDKIYKTCGYRVITIVHLREHISLDIKVNYNIIVKEFIAEKANLIEMSYVARTSDLLLITISDGNIETDYITLLKKFMPMTLVVYTHNDQKVYAKVISKMFGDVKLVKSILLNNILKNFNYENNRICKIRPFMVVKNAYIENNKMILEGFMKKGLVSNKVIINGQIEALIEEVMIGNTIISGNELNIEENPDEYCIDDIINHEDSIYTDEYSDTIEEYDDNVEHSAYFDLIEQYKDYKGIRNFSECNFKNTVEMAHLKFFKRFNHLENKLAKREKKISNNQYLKLKINCIINDINIIVFNLFEYELQPTILNYSFSNFDMHTNTNICIDNGFRIFTSKIFVTSNLFRNIFKVEKTLHDGSISFIGPVTFFSTQSLILSGENKYINLLNCNAEKRVFLEEVILKGYPIKIFKHYVVIRGMFYDADQVKYFKTVKLETKNGNIGFIKKSLGTKGLFKAQFNNSVHHGDEIFLKLYKRVFL